jgi:hypothetical protein
MALMVRSARCACSERAAARMLSPGDPVHLCQRFRVERLGIGSGTRCRAVRRMLLSGGVL